MTPGEQPLNGMDVLAQRGLIGNGQHLPTAGAVLLKGREEPIDIMSVQVPLRGVCLCGGETITAVPLADVLAGYAGFAWECSEGCGAQWAVKVTMSIDTFLISKPTSPQEPPSAQDL